MTRTLVPEPGQDPSQAPHPKPPPSTHRELVAGILWALDALLSGELRRGTASELASYRTLAGASFFMFLSSLLALMILPAFIPVFAMLPLALGCLAALIVLRRAASHHAAAMLLCASVALGSTAMAFSLKQDIPYAGAHSTHMLLPALAAYLLGPRRGFLLTLFLCASMGVLYPLYYAHFGYGAGHALDATFWPQYLFSNIAFVGAWGLGSLHGAAREEAQATVEQTLKELSDSRSMLVSIFESTHDLLAALDPEGRLITANAAAKKAYRLRFGHEPIVGQPFIPETASQLRAVWLPRLAKALSGERQRFEEIYEQGELRLTFDASVNPIQDVEGRITGATLFARNITARKEAELRLEEMHRSLVDVSRQAGMAEIATGVLHNVGNTLNSVNVSTTLVIDQLRKSRLSGLARATALLQEHSARLPSFLTEDPQGQQLPAYLSALSSQLHEEHEGVLKEMHSLRSSVEHIRSIVSMQQKHARTAGTQEEVAVPQLIDEALRLHAAAFGRLGIQLERDYAQVPPLLVDRHRLLQILVNLVNNARDALTVSEAKHKRLCISVHPAPESGRLRIQVTDNGLGIAPEHLPRMFSQGFTTKKDGHGFGLHISALAAMEMQGRLTCASMGLGHGAVFTLELPLK